SGNLINCDADGNPTGSSPLRCPAEGGKDTKRRGSHYGINYYMDFRDFKTDGYNNDKWRCETPLTNPSSTCIFGEIGPASGDSELTFGSHMGDNPRHGDSMNIGFGDGHVENLKGRRIPFASGTYATTSADAAAKTYFWCRKGESSYTSW
ncbi:MAG: hypothetical protein J6S21_07750, partial [Victivallales bacterium]|nr:hypothetical protein [Victivallales bacterium]